jgi:hypothetical protein
MADQPHAIATAHLPGFITAPGEADVLMVVLAVFLVLFVLTMGLLYFRLHALPEQWAHKKVQMEIVCVLALIAMFTHMHIFWIAGLLLAMVDLPDFGTPLKRIAASTEKIAEEREEPEPPAVSVAPSSDRSRAADPADSRRTAA